MRAAAERAGVRGGRALPQPAHRGPPPGRAAGGRQARDRHGRRDRASPRAGETAAVQVFPLRDGRLVDRHTLLPRERGRPRTCPSSLEAFCLEYYGERARRPAADRRPARGRRDRGARRAPLRPPRLGRRGARRRGAARSGGSRSSRQQNAELALESDSASRERKRLRRIEALEELREALNLESLPIADRVLRHLEHPGRVAGRLDGRLPGRACRRRPTTGSSGSGASRARTTSR